MFLAMRKVCFIVLASIFCMEALAQSKTLGSAQGSVNEKSLAILNAVSNTYKNSTGTQIDLKIGFIDNKTALTASSNGTLKTTGKKFLLVTDFAEMVFDGKTLYVYDKQSNELTISTPTQDEVSDLDPTAIISMFKEGYKISAPEVSKTDSNLTTIHLYPEDRKADFSMITITINTATSTPVEINTSGKNGVDNSVTLKKIETNKKFSDNTFEFNADKHKGIIVTDLR